METSPDFTAAVWLEEVDRREKLLEPGASRRDPSAAAGAWSQYARRRRVFDQIRAVLPERQVAIVLSDMVPSSSGIDVVDQPRPLYLAELALDMAAKVLKGGGDALIKVFQGAGFQELIPDARGRFAKVKPAASRARNPEMYLLAKVFRLV
jgi:23S rRNA (uridine2552-2'-O)-methyltransferase